MRRRLLHLVQHPAFRLCIVAALFAAILTKVDRAALLRLLQDFDPVFGALMVALFLILLGVFTLRWWLILRGLGAEASYWRCLRVFWISQAVSEVGPPLIVGELSRFSLMRDVGEPWTLAASQFCDRISGKLILLGMVVALLPGYLQRMAEFPLLRLALFALLVAGVLTLGLVLFRRFADLSGKHFVAILRMLHPLRHPGHYLLSLVIQSLLACNFALAALALKLPVDPLAVVALGPLLLLGIGSLPGAVSDWGKREAVAVVLLAPAGLSAEQSLAVALAYGISHTIAAAPGALLWLAERRKPVVR